VVDPPKNATPPAKSAAILPFVAAMAGFDTGAGQWLPIPDPGRSSSSFLAVAHPG